MTISFSSTEKYKLTYFNTRGEAEPIRYIFALADVEFEDVRIKWDDWNIIKPATKWGHVPFLEVNGVEIAQSLAIGRYLARKYKLAGESPMEEFQCDEIIETLRDLKPLMRPIFMEQDEGKKKVMKAEFLSTEVKPILAKLNKIKENNDSNWLVGKKITWADVHLSHKLDTFSHWDPNILNDYPSLKMLMTSFFALPQIQQWIEKRPISQWSALNE